MVICCEDADYNLFTTASLAFPRLTPLVGRSDRSRQNAAAVATAAASVAVAAVAAVELSLLFISASRGWEGGGIRRPLRLLWQMFL